MQGVCMQMGVADTFFSQRNRVTAHLLFTLGNPSNLKPSAYQHQMPLIIASHDSLPCTYSSPIPFPSSFVPQPS